MDEALIKRVLPHSIEAEQAVLGSMLTDKEAVSSSIEVLKEEIPADRLGTAEEAAEMIRGAGLPDSDRFLDVKPTARGCVSLGVTVDRYHKLERFAKLHNVSMKSVIEAYIDSLPED